jgi:hypothetical protein
VVRRHPEDHVQHAREARGEDPVADQHLHDLARLRDRSGGKETAEEGQKRKAMGGVMQGTRAMYLS